MSPSVSELSVWPHGNCKKHECHPWILTDNVEERHVGSMPFPFYPFGQSWIKVHCPLQPIPDFCRDRVLVRIR